MAIAIPTLPKCNVTFKYIGNFTDLKPSFGGKHQRINRLGDRFSIEVAARPMSYDQGAGLVVLLNKGLSQKVIFKVPQAMAVGTPGSPKVASAGQAGSTLTINGLTNGYQFKPGQYFSIVSNGVRYLHQVASATVASGNTCVADIVPMLRISPNLNDVIEVIEPRIEGFLIGNSNNWTVDQCHSIGLTFGIEEAE